MATSSFSRRNWLTHFCFVVSMLATGLIAGNAFASGGASGGSFGGGSASRPVDESYEYGKAIYLGRLPDSQKLNYCVLEDGELKKLKKRTLKPYRGKTQKELANALYLCEDMSELALKSLKKEQIAFVLYYLNKRYRLKLTDA